MKEQIENLLQQKLNRKEFLQYIGSGILIVLGVANLIQALQMPVKKPTGSVLAGPTEYGWDNYGGVSQGGNS